MKTNSILRAAAWLYLAPRVLALLLILAILGLAAVVLLLQMGVLALRSLAQ